MGRKHRGDEIQAAAFDVGAGLDDKADENVAGLPAMPALIPATLQPQHAVVVHTCRALLNRCIILEPPLPPCLPYLVNP